MHLIACPQCSRQYDVTPLAPGSRVRCACDHLLDVGVPGDFAVATFHCRQCGAVAKPGDKECSYCGGGLIERDFQRTTLCPICFTRLDDDSHHCNKCGVEIHPQALTAIPEGVDCPRCKGVLGIRCVAEGEVIECTACGGIWLDPTCFDRIYKAAQDKETATFRTPGAEPPGSIPNTMAYIPCVRCGELMHRRQFRHRERSSGVVLDVCKDHGVWLDHSEIERIVTFQHQSGGALITERPAMKAETFTPRISLPRDRTAGEVLRGALTFLGDLFS